MTILSKSQDGATIRVRVVPNAKRTEIDGEFGSQLKIRLHAPPVDGKANKELTSFLAKLLGLKKSGITIIAGDKSRDKVVAISGVNADEIRNTLLNP
jgi:uncharacterized protein (TIGR00251 family)